jgi:aspartate dehydrogenase
LSDSNLLEIGVIGCGSMGAELAQAIGPHGIKGARVVALLDRSPEQGRALAASLDPHPNFFSSEQEFLSCGAMKIVAECASQAAVREHGVAVLESGRSLLLMSSGALMDPELFDALTSAAARSGAQIIVPSGAVGGIDALRAVQYDLDSVTIVSTKRPAALAGAPGFADWENKEISSPTTVFDGPAVEAVKLFPANVNVAATVSLAGIGPQRTMVRVVADPAAPGNVHEIRAKGGFGEFQFRLVNRPHPKNPKTSHLAVLAAIEALRALVNPGLRVGT